MPSRTLNFSHSITLIASALSLASTGFSASATGPAPSKSAYTLFNPTPTAQMRELTTDRPDQTESPFTVDAGHFQLEMDFFNYTYDREKTGFGYIRTRNWSFAPVNLKVGILNNVDLQLMAEPIVRNESTLEDYHLKFKSSGFGDVTTRLKINLWGNDGGTTAFGLMPFVKWPLSASGVRNGRTEGGLILPLAIQLGGGWDLGLMTELDFVRNDYDTGYDREWVNSITVSRDLTDKLGFYAEFFTVTGNAPRFKWQGQVDFGLTYALAPGVQLDAGCNFGVTKSVPDVQPFVGISYRY